jgi:nitroreductase
MTTANSRTTDHPISPIFLERWSPRALTGEEIPDATLLTIFDAARWAPSSFNSQPWRFLYAKKNSPNWPTFLGLLNEFNQSWAKNASALMVIVSKTTFVPPNQTAPVVSHTHSFDTGAAWANLALQASLLGWHAHGMAGFDHDRARRDLRIPDDHRIEVTAAIGKGGDKSMLPPALQARETPSPRAALSSVAIEGGFK